MFNGRFELTEERLKRYSRQVILQEVGGKGQKKLLSSSVFVVGAGGLGSPVLLYLAAAGVGKIGIADYDKVDISNLQRQVLFTTDDIGKSKAEVAKERLQRLNPDVEVEIVNEKISAKNVLDVIKNYDVIVDGSDNFSTRYVVSDACVILGKPYIYGGVLRFEGQASTFFAERGPCYRCVYPEPPPPGAVPSCQEAGVIGSVVGVIGLIQANEAIKFILGKGELLIGKLLVFDALRTDFRVYKVRKDENCLVCGKDPKIKEPEDIEEYCRI